MLRMIERLLRSDQGATAVEYGLIVSLIFLAAAGAMEAFGTAANDMWSYVSTTAFH